MMSFFIPHREMSGAAMSLSAAVSGCVVFLLSVSVLQGQDNWRVTDTSIQICALKGSTVDINCTYSFPSRLNEHDSEVKTTLWFAKGNHGVCVDLRRYAGRARHHCDKNHCSLRITDLRESDSAEYKLTFTPNQPKGRNNDLPGINLTVTDLQLQVKSTDYSTWRTHLKCFSSCRLPDSSSYVWYQNGEEIHRGKSASHSLSFLSGDSFSCAVEEHEDFPSPSVCFDDELCIRVLYTDRNICASRGSSVNISCSYSSVGSIKSSFWFSPERHHRWQTPSQPEDLSEDSQYAGRVRLLETSGGGSTLTISGLRDTDSAQYRFTFKTPHAAWGRSLSGTTLTVTGLRVQVNTVTVHQSDAEAELQCVGSCSPAAPASYVWFKNGQKVEKEETFLYSWQFNPDDDISCALKGHEEYRSPSVYAPKLPSVSVSPPGEIVESGSVTLTCSSDANPAADYAWYMKDEDPDLQPLSKEPQLVFSSIQSCDSGEYFCTAENQLGKRTSEHIFIDVKLLEQSILIMNIIRLTLLILMLILLVPFSLWIRKKSSTSDPNQPAETIESDCVVYENPAELQDVTAAQTDKDTEDYDDVE